MDLSRSTVWNSGIVTDPIRSTVWISGITTDLSRSTGWVSFTLDQGRSTSIANEYMKRQNRGGGGDRRGSRRDRREEWQRDEGGSKRLTNLQVYRQGQQAAQGREHPLGPA